MDKETRPTSIVKHAWDSVAWEPDDPDVGRKWQADQIFAVEEAIRNHADLVMTPVTLEGGRIGGAVNGDALERAAVAVCEALWPKGSRYLDPGYKSG